MGAHWPLAEGIASQPTSVVNPCVPEGGAADIVAVWRGRWPGGALNAFVVEELLRPPVNELLGVEVGAEAVAGELDEGRQLLLTAVITDVDCLTPHTGTREPRIGIEWA